jgi:chorismate mutase
MEIAEWRQQIDEMDEQIVQLISKRAEAAKAIGDIKRKTTLPVYERILDVMRTLQRRDL